MKIYKARIKKNTNGEIKEYGRIPEMVLNILKNHPMIEIEDIEEVEGGE